MLLMVCQWLQTSEFIRVIPLSIIINPPLMHGRFRMERPSHLADDVESPPHWTDASKPGSLQPQPSTAKHSQVQPSTAKHNHPHPTTSNHPSLHSSLPSLSSSACKPRGCTTTPLSGRPRRSPRRRIESNANRVTPTCLRRVPLGQFGPSPRRTWAVGMDGVDGVESTVLSLLLAWCSYRVLPDSPRW